MRTSAYKVDVASDRRRRENVPRHILYILRSAKVLICFPLFQQIVICEVVDAHGVTNIVQCFGGGFSGCGAAFF